MRYNDFNKPQKENSPTAFDRLRGNEATQEVVDYLQRTYVLSEPKDASDGALREWKGGHRVASDLIKKLTTEQPNGRSRDNRNRDN